MALKINGIRVAGVGANGRDGVGVIPGGESGQILSKGSDADYDTAWIDLPSTDTTLSQKGQAADAKAVGDQINTINETKANKEEIPSLTSQLENDSNFISEEEVRNMVGNLSSDRVLRFYCVEDVTIITNGVSKTYPANSSVEVKFLDTDVFEIVPTSDNSILALNAWPGALGTYYSWLEGVKQFSNILFDMNNEEFYSKWSQGNQGMYQVQFA